MEQSVGSTLERIKLQEQDKEAKLKEKREHESMVMSIHRAIREATTQTQKMAEEYVELTKATVGLQARVLVATAKRDALWQQINACHKELEELREISDKGISEVWAIRSSLSEAVQNTSEECDVWALLMKPKFTELIPKPIKKIRNDTENEIEYQNSLKAAMEKREKVLAERDRLTTEPETGEEFIRIKNALRYSAEMSANLRN